ncbi:MAG: lipopolysaccharide transport periplasmic protein LptA [Thiotrichaceae bacterium]|nr:lipopolysaccharide transport periplasmic protein LptA [Thiotrichaceae bacterium]
MYFHKLLFLLLLSTNVFALSTDREQPIRIEADSAKLDNIKMRVVYQGNVIITQGTIRLTAEQVILNYTKKQEIDKVIALGKPAYFQQRLDSGEDIKAQAKEMEYDAQKNTLYLKKNAELTKGKNGQKTYTSNAPRIMYDTQRGIIKADKGKENEGRIIMTFKPQPKNK